MDSMNKFKVLTIIIICMFLFIIAAIYSNTKDAAVGKTQTKVQSTESNKRNYVEQNTNDSQQLQSQIEMLNKRIDEMSSNSSSDLICKIIGVFIDNSIEAVKSLEEKNINIELYIKNKNLCIKVSNNYKGNIDISKISDEGYTTKGKGHGYGLSLVNNIVKNNNLFENRTEISKNVFSQILIIKIKKHINK